MAKKARARKRRKPAARKRVTRYHAARRLTGTCLDTPTAAPPRKGTRRRAATTRALRGPGETLQVTLELRDVSDRLIRDPETFFTFRRVADRRQIGDQLALELTGSSCVFDLPVATARSRSARSIRSDSGLPTRPCSSDRPARRSSGGSAPARAEGVDAALHPVERPAGQFSELKRVLAESPNMTLVQGTEAIADLLVEGAYDGMSGGDVILAKTALLNAHFRLNAALEPVSKTGAGFRSCRDSSRSAANASSRSWTRTWKSSFGRSTRTSTSFAPTTNARRRRITAAMCRPGCKGASAA